MINNHAVARRLCVPNLRGSDYRHESDFTLYPKIPSQLFRVCSLAHITDTICDTRQSSPTGRVERSWSFNGEMSIMG